MNTLPTSTAALSKKHYPAYRLPSAGGKNAFRADVLLGLSRPKKSIPSKYLYDEKGSRLFEEICRTPEYYPTRTEKHLLRAHADEISDLMGGNVALIELGCGNGEKVGCFLHRLANPALYAPVDISSTALDEMARRFETQYPSIPLHPVRADYTNPESLKIPTNPGTKRVLFFPGSTIGNMDPNDAIPFLQGLSNIADAFLVGVDLKKDSYTLNLAYNDRKGATEQFNLNLLHRINRELEADFEPENFEHLAFYNAPYGRVEMHLVSRRRQSVKVSGITFEFAPGETLQTESSYKYAPYDFQAMLLRGGFRPLKCWQDDRQLFSVHYAEIFRD